MRALSGSSNLQCPAPLLPLLHELVPREDERTSLDVAVGQTLTAIHRRGPRKLDEKLQEEKLNQADTAGQPVFSAGHSYSNRTSAQRRGDKVVVLLDALYTEARLASTHQSQSH